MDEINYDTMGKEALRQEMRDRELSYSKMNNDQMRAALRADDSSHSEFGASEFEMSKDELAAQQPRAEVVESKPAPAAKPDKPAPASSKTSRVRSTTDSPVKKMWDMLDAEPGLARKLAVERGIAMGISPNTAATQFQWWRKARGLVKGSK